MSGSLGEREIEVGTLARRASVSTLFRDFSNFHECVYKYGTRGGDIKAYIFHTVMMAYAMAYNGVNLSIFSIQL